MEDWDAEHYPHLLQATWGWHPFYSSFELILSVPPSDPFSLCITHLLKVGMCILCFCNNAMFRGFILCRGQSSSFVVSLNIMGYLPLSYHTLPMAQLLPMSRNGRSSHRKSMGMVRVRGCRQPRT